MEKKINQTPNIHGIIVTTLLIMPMVWSATTFIDDVSPGEPGPGASPAHTIPSNGAKVESWFSKTIKHAKERKDIEPDLVAAEAKTKIIKVRSDGSGNFKTIKEAVDSVEINRQKNRVIIDIGPGIYKEKITINRFQPYITLYGNPHIPPLLTFEASTPEYGSMDTATLTVEGDYFSAVNILIANTVQLQDRQVGLALRVRGNYASFYNCKIAARKSTLLDERGNHLFKDCLIDGSDKIIYGDGRSIYLDSEIHVRPNEPTSIIAGHVRTNLDPRGGGFVFAHCRVTGEPNVKAFLGRTDMPNTRVIYAYSNLTNIVEPKGWYEGLDTSDEKTGFLGEYKNIGEGADMSQRINLPNTNKLTEMNVQPFLSLDFIDAGEWLLPAPRLVDDFVESH